MSLAESTRDRFQRFSATRVECPLCGSDDLRYEFLADRSAFSSCRGCRLLLASHPGSGGAETLNVAPIGEFAEAIERYIGCRPGSSAIVGEPGDKQVGDVVVKNSFEAGERFDVIFIIGKIVGDDPIATLESIREHLEPGGVAVFGLPSTSSTMAKRSRSAWPALRSPTRYFFCPDNAALLATRAGFGDFMTFVVATDIGDRVSKSLDEWFRSNFLMFARPVNRSPERLLSVIFPVFNEANTVVESLTRVIGKNIPGVDVEIVVVESNSTDGSRELVEAFRNEPRVRLILEDRPRGKGYAVRTGLKHARGEVVLFQDADLEYDVNDYDKLVAPLFDMRQNVVLGSRHDGRGAGWKIRTFADQPVVATVANLAHLALLAMFNRLYKQRLRDPFTMYKVFRRDALHGLTFDCNRFDFDYEIVIKLLRKGYQVEEIPVNYTSRSFKDGKKVAFFRDPPTWVRAMLRLRRSKLYWG